MDISRMRPVRISPFASARVMVDHFPTVDEETAFKDLNLAKVNIYLIIIHYS